MVSINQRPMKNALYQIIAEIENEEKKLIFSNTSLIDEAHKMILYLQSKLLNTKKIVMEQGFDDLNDEIEFFRNIKPKILGKLIYYNKVYKIEIGCPARDGKLYEKYYQEQLKALKTEFQLHIINSPFYRYYRSGRTDKNSEYFIRGKLQNFEEFNSFIFELDPDFSTYYDFKVAKIIANELIYNYLNHKIIPSSNNGNILHDQQSKDMLWTESNNALIELIYALYAYGAISNGKIGIRKITNIFQILFRVSLGDVHHAFHRMKTRVGSRTAFLDQLKDSLEEYMDKDL